MDSGEKRITVLASGGIDSTATVIFFLDRGYDVQSLHFEYGQANSRSELESFHRICQHYRLSGRTLNLGFRPILRETEMLCRNALFVMSAASVNPDTDIALGIHTGPPYYDCTSAFMQDCQRLLDGYFGGTLRVHAPFLNFSKRSIVEYGRTHGLPFDITYSCETGNDVPCGECPACLERESALGALKLA